jgi:hypothetical protein
MANRTNRILCNKNQRLNFIQTKVTIKIQFRTSNTWTKQQKLENLEGGRIRVNCLIIGIRRNKRKRVLKRKLQYLLLMIFSLSCIKTQDFARGTKSIAELFLMAVLPLEELKIQFSNIFMLIIKVMGKEITKRLTKKCFLNTFRINQMVRVSQ